MSLGQVCAAGAASRGGPARSLKRFASNPRRRSGRRPWRSPAAIRGSGCPPVTGCPAAEEADSAEVERFVCPHEVKTGQRTCAGAEAASSTRQVAFQSLVVAIVGSRFAAVIRRVARRPAARTKDSSPSGPLARWPLRGPPSRPFRVRAPLLPLYLSMFLPPPAACRERAAVARVAPSSFRSHFTAVRLPTHPFARHPLAIVGS